MTHHHASRREGNARPKSLGSFTSTQGAAAAVLVGAAARLRETGWVVEICDLPAEELGTLRLHNVGTDEEITFLMWPCGCQKGEADVTGVSPYPPRR